MDAAQSADVAQARQVEANHVTEELRILEEAIEAEAQAQAATAEDPMTTTAAPPPAAKPRTRTVKVVRLRAVWAVLDNSSKRIETFPYNQKAAAEQFVAEKSADKKNYYLQLVKEPWEEKA